ncbi:Coagulation factor X isoform 1 like protein [Argiope bruennichi]|uniref:Coagulation factor X isoform 1 like protein n=1 Tax=Argiope bruennichi TaxID=94029 RepID=A0A8T0FHR9_ARGBR|nr:Coagulation factor X isoform 1 like protein [Argiope bruennichi]
MQASQATLIAMGFIVAFAFYFSVILTVSAQRDGDFNSNNTLGAKGHKRKTCIYCGRCKWCKVSDQIKSNKIVRPMNKYPWMVALYHKNGDFICGGAIISPTFIITSAHCLVPFNFSEKESCESTVLSKSCYIPVNRTEVVLLGKKNFTERIKVKKIIPHKYFSPHILSHDIALVQLESPIKCNKRVFPICLPTRNFLQLGGKKPNCCNCRGGTYQAERKLTDSDSSPVQVSPQKIRLPDRLPSFQPICTIGKRTRHFFALGKGAHVASPDEYLCKIRTSHMKEYVVSHLKAGIRLHESVFRQEGDAGSIAVAKLGQFSFIMGITAFDVKFNCKIESRKHNIYTRIFHYVKWIIRHVEDLSSPI